MFSLRSAALATIAAAALVPAAASANTYCVFAADCSGTPEWSIQDAVNASDSDTELARIVLGEGTYSGNVVVGARPAGLDIVGEGPDKTFLEPMDATKYALELHGATVSQVGLDPGTGSMPTLLLADGATADHISAVAPAGYLAAPVRIQHGGHVAHASIDGQNTAVEINASAGTDDATISDSELRGHVPIQVFDAGHTLTARRDRLVVTSDNADAVTVAAGAAVIEDSLIDLRGHSGAIGLQASAGSGVNVAISARHLTMLADGANSTGVVSASTPSFGAASVSLSDSVLDGVKTRARRVGGSTLALARVDTWPAAPDAVNGGAISDQGSFSADPLLTADLVPGAGSPLLDAAAPIAAGESDTDMNGAARTLDGDGNCDPRPDIGAIEAPAATCTPASPPAGPNIQQPPPARDTTAPILSRLRLSHHRMARFTLSEKATVRLTLRRCANRACTRTRRALAAKTLTAPAGATQLRLRRVPPGRYVLRASVTDAAGNRGTTRNATARVG